jgi:UDP-N-acetylmuramyl pentapeptide phosphotransferase/UDP-N-acetylglucosamine-1-phosphate transferase
LGAFVTSALAVWLFMRIARRSLVDKPGGRSSHALPTPTGAGFPAVCVGLASASLGVLLGVVAWGPAYWAAAVCAVVLSCLGLADDALDLPRSLRYAAHLCVAAAAVVWLGPFAAESVFAFALGLAALVLVSGLINAFNFMDGIDALVAGTGGLILAYLGFRSGDAAWLCFAAAYAGFLLFNLPPARTFMGDAGSTTLGGLVAIALLSARTRLALADLAVLLPLMGDAGYTILRRLLRGENIFLAHHSHVYQRLFRAGLPHGKISFAYAVATALAAWLGGAFGNAGALAAVAGCAALVLGLELYLTRRGVPFARPPRATLGGGVS